MTKPRSSSRHATSSRYPRTARINEVLRELIANDLERHIDEDPRLNLVTITAVETDPDLGRAKVFFSALDNTYTNNEVIGALDEQRVEWQKEIGRTVRMKRTPQLIFERDPSIAEGQKIESILRTIEIPKETPPGTSEVEDSEGA